MKAGNDRGRGDSAALHTAAVALAVTLAIQIFTSLAAMATAVLAPEIARHLALPSKLVGVFVGLVYVGGAAASLASGGFIERYGAIRVSQVAVLSCAAGVAVIAAIPAPPGAFAFLLAVAALIIGVGYGPITPASSQVLARTAPPARMALTFSIKQTGVPAGAALAGAALPAIALHLGWRSAFVAVAMAGVAIAIAAEASRTALDVDRQVARRLSWTGIAAPLRIVFAKPALVELSAIGFFYAATQMCLMSFLVVYFTDTLAFSLVVAGLALTVANVAGIAGRIAWGVIADRFVSPRTLLGLLGLAAGACAGMTALMSGGWSMSVSLLLCGAFGATAIGWNGVQLAEVARHAPNGQAGAVTGAASFFAFIGVVLGPPLFALLAGLTGSYRVGFAVFGGLSMSCGLFLLARRK